MCPWLPMSRAGRRITSRCLDFYGRFGVPQVRQLIGTEEILASVHMGVLLKRFRGLVVVTVVKGLPVVGFGLEPPAG